MSVLSEMKVLDFTQMLAGPYCTLVLADMGAEVIKVEKYPQGDDIRQIGPYTNGESACFMSVNRNKKSLRLNLAVEEGRQIAFQLIKEADVLVESFRPGVTKNLGIDYETAKSIQSSLIYCSISGYGQTGPLRDKGGYDIMAQGMSGIMSMTGPPGGPPVKVGIAIHDLAAGVTALYNILLAYIHRLKTGEGQYIDVSLLESGLAWTFWEAAAYFASGEIPQPSGSRHRRGVPYQGYRTQNGHVLVGATNQRLWEKFCSEVVEQPSWVKDPRFLSNQDRQKNIDILEEKIESIFILEPTGYWVEKMEKAGVPCAPILNYGEAVNHPHIVERGLIQEIGHPVAGLIKLLASPAKLSKTSSEIRIPPPLLGEHTEGILSRLGYTPEEIELFSREGVI